MTTVSSCSSGTLCIRHHAPSAFVEDHKSYFIPMNALNKAGHGNNRFLGTRKPLRHILHRCISASKIFLTMVMTGGIEISSDGFGFGCRHAKYDHALVGSEVAL